MSLPFVPPTPEQIAPLRSDILKALMAQDAGLRCVPVRSIQPSTLSLMLTLYDARVFSGYLSRSYRALRVTLSTRMTSAAGKFIHARIVGGRAREAEIRMSGDFLFRLKEGPFLLNGLSVATPQEAFLVVFEHELCHALEYALYGSTGHSARFVTLANTLFGHTGIRHSLPTRKTQAAANGLICGAQAAFSFQGRSLCGVITYIGKTATVMVPDSSGEYRDKKGRRYAKYRVPLPLLRPC